jgi:hypothetical protein
MTVSTLELKFGSAVWYNNLHQTTLRTDNGWHTPNSIRFSTGGSWLESSWLCPNNGGLQFLPLVDTQPLIGGDQRTLFAGGHHWQWHLFLKIGKREIRIALDNGPLQQNEPRLTKQTHGPE